MPNCETCGEHVTTDYVRVFGDRQGRVHACRACETKGVDPRRAAGLTIDHA